MRLTARRSLVLAAFLLLPLCARAATESIAGSIKTVVGTVTVLRNGETVPAKEGLHLLVSDTLRTSADSRLALILQDGTRISLGANTELSLKDFVYRPSEGKFSLIIGLARGMMAYVSGKIASFMPQAVKVETPVGTIGLRGTEFAVSLEGS